MQPTIRRTLNTKPPNAKNLNLAVYYKVTTLENNLIPSRTLLRILQGIDTLTQIDVSRDVAGPLNLSIFLLTLQYAKRTFPKIVKIDFSGNAVNNEVVRQCIAATEFLPNLRSINLSGGNFGSPGARLLLKMRHAGIQITCCDCRAVRGIDRLEMHEAGIEGM